jgi:hypothetical protein
VSPEIAKKALEILENPKTRTTARLARAANGEPVDPLSPDAVCWCGIGALIKAGGRPGKFTPGPYGTPTEAYYESPEVLELGAVLPQSPYSGDLVSRVWTDNDFNDAREIIARLRKIVERAGAEGPA